MDVQEVRKLDAYLKRVFGNPKIRVVPRPKKEDSAEVYIGEEFIGVLFVDDEPRVLTTMRMLFRAHYEVYFAEGGAAGFGLTAVGAALRGGAV